MISLGANVCILRNYHKWSKLQCMALHLHHNLRKGMQYAPSDIFVFKSFKILHGKGN